MAHIRYAGPEAVLDALVERYPILAPQKEDIRALYELIRQSFASGGKLLVCGNGGSAADALHIVGELMKSFTLPRPIDPEVACILGERFGQEGERLAASLEGALPAVALVENAALSTALQNDVSGGISFAQQVYGLGRPGDVLLCISTSRQRRKRRGGGHGCARARHARGAALRRHGRKAASPVRRERGGGRIGNLYGTGIAPARLSRPVPDAGVRVFPTGTMISHHSGGPGRRGLFLFHQNSIKKPPENQRTPISSTAVEMLYFFHRNKQIRQRG